MKKYSILGILSLIILCSGCITTHIFIENGYTNLEISTQLTESQVGGMDSKPIIDKFFEKISKKFQFDKKKIIKNREVMQKPKRDLYEVRKDLIPLQDFIVDRFWHKSYDYRIQRDIKNKNLYHIYKGEKILFSHPMTYGSESTIQEAIIIIKRLPDNNIIQQEAFTFYDYKILSGSREPIHSRNIRYNGETMNEKYNLSGSSYLFIYNDKIGLVGERNDKKFILFDGIKISDDYDEISTYSCCGFHHYPLQLDINGNFLFLAKKGTQHVFVEISLINKKTHQLMSF